MTRSFALTYDYLCPFACIVHDVVVDALVDGADWDVEFVPFSLSEVHVHEGEPSVWERPIGSPGTSGLLAHTWALAVRAKAPDHFLDFHSAMFAARHRAGSDINDPNVVRSVAAGLGLDVDALDALVASGEPAAMLGEHHRAAVEAHYVFGVPTLISGDQAAFVRLMERDRAEFEKVLELMEMPNLNEFKRTVIPR